MAAFVGAGGVVRTARQETAHEGEIDFALKGEDREGEKDDACEPPRQQHCSGSSEEKTQSSAGQG